MSSARRATRGPLVGIFAAWSAATVGGGVYSVAVGVYAESIGGTRLVGGVLAARLLVAAVTSATLAYVADRFPRGHVIIAADASRALLLVAGGVLQLEQAPWPAVVAPFLIAEAISAVARPAFLSLVGDLSQEAGRLGPISIFTAIEQASYLVGPAVGGLVVGGAGVAAAFVLTAASFVSSAVGITVAIASGAHATTADTGTVLLPRRAAARVVLASAAVTPLVALLWVQTFTAGVLFVDVVHLALREIGRSAESLGLLNAAVGAGGIVGALVAAAIGRAEAASAFVGVSLALWGIAVACLGGVTDLPLALVVVGAAGLASGVFDAVVYGTLQRRIPATHASAAFGVVESGVLLTLAAGSATAGAIDAPRATLVAAGIVSVAVAAVAVTGALRARA